MKYTEREKELMSEEGYKDLEKQEEKRVIMKYREKEKELMNEEGDKYLEK